MRDVISAVEIVIDEYFPIAFQFEHAASGEVQLFEMHGLEALHHRPEELRERGRLRIHAHEKEFLPGLDAQRDKSCLLALETFHAIEFRDALERATEAVCPA